MNREKSLQQIHNRPTPFDLAIIGGGATGIGCALDAASRNYSTLLLEAHDFGKGTSSRSTKLIHGGVRYLQQGNISLVMEALKERGILRNNAPHLVHDLAFIVPNYAWWEAPFYGIGMKVYDLLAGKFGFGKSRLLSKAEVLDKIPTLEPEALRGGVLYYDGQFDDARLLIDLAHTATAQGATLLNYARVTNLLYDNENFINGLQFLDTETNTTHSIRAKAIINATGAFSDNLRKLDDPAAPQMIAPSQGIHLVLDKSFLPGESAIMVPHTSDGRVMFAIPWHNHTLLGTTDIPVTTVPEEPIATAEINFILETAAKYLHKPPAKKDILSVFAGIRPLFKSSTGTTSSLARDHTITVSKTGLLTIAGGKWTTYRKMAEDAVNQAATLANLEDRPCITPSLPIPNSAAKSIPQLIESTPALAELLDPELDIRAADVIYAVREEMARTVEDILARRTRALFLDANRALALSPRVANLMAHELSKDAAWQHCEITAFATLAQNYLVRTN